MNFKRNFFNPIKKMDAPKEPALEKIFNQRREAFINSLNRSVSIISSDQLVKQLFDDPNSNIYIPDRICDMIRQLLYDDREDFITELSTKLRSIEICFGPKLSQEVEEVGKKILNIPAHSPENFKNRELFLKKLQSQLKNIESEYFFDAAKNSQQKLAQIKNKTKSLNKSMMSISESIESFEFEMKNIFRKAKGQIFTIPIHSTSNSNQGKSTHSNSKEDLETIKEELEMIRQENKTLKVLAQINKTQIDENSKRVDENEKEAEIKKLKKSLQEAKQQIEEFTKIKSLMDQDDNNQEIDLYSFIQRTKKESQNAKSEIISLRKKNDQLLSANKELKNQSLQIETNFEKLRSDLMEKKLGVNNEQVLDLLKENTDLKTKVKNLLGAGKELNNLNKTLQNQISELTLLNDSHKKDSLSFKENSIKEIQKQKMINEEISNEKERIHSELQTLKSDNKIIQNELNKLREMNSNLLEENTELQSKNRVNENSMKMYQADKDTIANELISIQRKIAHLENENISLKAENQELKILHEEILNNCAELKEAADTLTQINSKLATQNSDLSTINEASKVDKKFAQSFREQIQQQQMEVSQNLITISQLKQENMVLRNSQIENQSLKETLNQLNLETSELKSTINKMKNEISNLESRLNEKDRKLSLQNIENAKLEQKLKENEDKLDAVKSVSGLSGSKADQLINYVSQNENLQQSLRSMENQLLKVNETNAKLNHAYQKSIRKIDSLTHELKEYSYQNEKLQSQNNSFHEMKRRLSQLSGNPNILDSSSTSNISISESDEFDDLSKLIENISRSKHENRTLTKAVKILNKFQKNIFYSLNAHSAKEAESLLKNLIEQQTEDLNKIKRIKEIFNINETENIILELKNRLQKMNTFENERKLIRNALRINDEHSDIYNTIVTLKARAEGNETRTASQETKNAILLQKLIILLQVDNGDPNKLPLAVQAIQAQINEDRILFRQLRQIFEVNNNDNIIETAQSVVLKTREIEDSVNKIGRIINCPVHQEMPQKIYDLQLKLSILKEIKNLLHINRDEEIIASIQKSLGLIDQLQVSNNQLNNQLNNTMNSQMSNQINNQLNNSMNNPTALNNSSINASHPNNNSSLMNSVVGSNISNLPVDAKEMQRIQIIGENENLLTQLSYILKVDQKIDILSKVQRLTNYMTQACHLMQTETHDGLIEAINKALLWKNKIKELKVKLSEKEQNVNRMQQMMHSLESQVAEISNFAEAKKKQSELTNSEITNLQTTLKSSSQKMESLHSKIEKKNETISNLKESINSLQSENEKLATQKSTIESSLVELQSKIKKLEENLQVSSIEKLPDLIEDFKSKLATFSKVPISNEAEMKRIETFRNCLKEISSVLISTDVRNFAREIEELKKQNDDLIKMKNHLSFALTLKLNESLTSKVDEILREANDSNSILGKLCLLLNVPSREEVTPAVDSLVRENQEMKNLNKMLQSAASVNSQQTLLKSVKSMKQKVAKVVDRFNFYDDHEIDQLADLMKKYQTENVEDFSHKIHELQENSNKFETIMTQLKLKSMKELPSLLKKINKYQEFCSILEKIENLNENVNYDEIQKLNELVNTHLELSKILNSNNIVKNVTNILNVENEICTKFELDNIHQLEKIFSKYYEIKNQQNEVCQLLNIDKPNMIQNEIMSLQASDIVMKKLQKNYNAQDVQGLLEIINQMKSQIQQESAINKKLCKRLNVQDENQMHSQIQMILKQEKKLCKLLKIEDFTKIHEKISSVLNTNDKIAELFKTTDIYETAQAIIHLFDVISKLLNLDLSSNSDILPISTAYTEIEKAINKIQNDLNSAANFFTKIFTILSNQGSPVKFPISSDLEQRIIKLLTSYKQNNEECQVITAKAASLGFKGDQIAAAVEYLLSNTKNQEQANFENESKKYMEIAQIELDKEKKKSQITKLKMKKVVSQLKHKLAEIYESEERLGKKLKKEKKNHQLALVSLQKEKEINESLLTIIQGNVQFSNEYRSRNGSSRPRTPQNESA
ncbi:hypothetical protein TRFO_17096 [Tritrichomonas foetus]|uniref:Uncharacterized protein n=1 Tax=Tritrichomonas foetus TaxID=1144522 RepID=A0A1J4KP12_9EUKA|nr:hypothetical protein TRFO_17096 [Tritrichomonas foetus]|eukprot:OHT12850.1 hypothetical protein TRFO_17096 [Tritrichomonas foetus]